MANISEEQREVAKEEMVTYCLSFMLLLKIITLLFIYDYITLVTK